jgi:hypothetical protein
MNSVAPWQMARSEAFAEDLIEDHAEADTPRQVIRMHSATLLCAVPVVVALLGGVVAFIHTVG